jgi:hypothetical protein
MMVLILDHTDETCNYLYALNLLGARVMPIKYHK